MLQKTVGVFALHEEGGGLDAGIGVVLQVHNFHAVPPGRRPAGIHAQHHLRPVHGIYSAGACVNGQDGTVVIIFAGQEGFQEEFVQTGVQVVEGLQDLVCLFIVLHLFRQFDQSLQIFEVSHEIFVGLHFRIQFVFRFQEFLSRLRVVPEVLLQGHFREFLRPLFHASQVKVNHLPLSVCRRTPAGRV